MVVGGTASGVGKTTVATGLMAALRARGTRVAAAKVGPDFIDPGYHALATGRPGRNLDSWICGEGAVAPLAGRASLGADVLVVEGVMGLFDGAAIEGPDASTASVSRLIDAPVVLVVDGSSMSGSVAALVHGFSTYDAAVRVAGVVVNRVGSDGHEALLRKALSPIGIPILGVLHRDDELTWRDRHLGLVPVAEHAGEVRRSLDRLASQIAASVDLDAVLALAATAPDRVVTAPPTPARVSPGSRGRPRVAVAEGVAFGFVYPDNLEALEAAGAELVPFDPLADSSLPADIHGLYVGGGFPEVFVADLASNVVLLADVRARIARGLVTWAECGGLLWLARALDGAQLANVVPADGRMTDRLTLGYRSATAGVDCPLAPAGRELRGHEFHYSELEPAGEALEMRGRTGTVRAGFASPTLLASYLHLHLGGDPSPAERFVAACLRGRADRP